MKVGLGWVIIAFFGNLYEVNFHRVINVPLVYTGSV